MEFKSRLHKIGRKPFQDNQLLLTSRALTGQQCQDLNQSDIDFIESLIHSGVTAFIAGDDDQSIYSFRYAAPSAIQQFPTWHPGVGNHVLADCFRCAQDVVASANTLIAHFALPNRIPKVLVSMHGQANPPEGGVVHRWHFHRDRDEADAVALSCRALIAAGIPSHELLVLVSNKRAQIPLLRQAFQQAHVEFDAPRADSFLDEDPGRFILSILRIVCDPNDYVAHRTSIGSLPGVGSGTCHRIAVETLNAAIRYRDIFYIPLPAHFLHGRALNAVNRARGICAQFTGWSAGETLAQRGGDLTAAVTQTFGAAAAAQWAAFTNQLPLDITLEELRDYVWADNDEQQAMVLERVYQRLNLQIPAGGFLPPKVRLMTMHGAKGLNATVVFIPGLEETILPGNFRQPYPGLVLEAARLLYVSITRARAACILSYADRRLVYGKLVQQHPSQFLMQTGGAFHLQYSGMTDPEVAAIVNARANVI